MRGNSVGSPVNPLCMNAWIAKQISRAEPQTYEAVLGMCEA